MLGKSHAAHCLQVGPGRYEHQTHLVEHGYAPFSSTAPRQLQPAPITTSAYTPGPGYYAKDGSAERPSPHRASADITAPFHCTGPKFAANHSSSCSGPGPGQYQLRGSWVKPDRCCTYELPTTNERGGHDRFNAAVALANLRRCSVPQTPCFATCRPLLR
jgi:hypothetical protein